MQESLKKCQNLSIYAEPGRNGGIYLLQDFILDRAILSESEKQEVLTAYALFLNGSYITNEQMNDKKFLKFL